MIFLLADAAKKNRTVKVDDSAKTKDRARSVEEISHCLDETLGKMDGHIIAMHKMADESDKVFQGVMGESTLRVSIEERRKAKLREAYQRRKAKSS